LYDPSELDLGAILKEEADQLIETLELPEMQEIEDAEGEDLLDTLETEVPAQPGLRKSLERPSGARQLLSPSLTPSQAPSDGSPTPSSGLSTPAPSTPLINEPLPAAPGNRAERGNEISAEFDPRNIIEGSRRRAAYITALEKNNELSGYHASFVTAVKKGYEKRPPHRDNLPPPPKSWKQMLKHQYSNEFKKAADKEYDALL
jgi:hypothetical protein